MIGVMDMELSFTLDTDVSNNQIIILVVLMFATEFI